MINFDAVLDGKEKTLCTGPRKECLAFLARAANSDVEMSSWVVVEGKTTALLSPTEYLALRP